MKTLLLAVLFTVLAATTASATTFATRIDVGAPGIAGEGWDAESQVFNTNRRDPGNALGAPDSVGDVEGGFFSIRNGAVAVFDFGRAFNGETTIYEVTFGCNGPQKGNSCNFAESVDVYALNDDYTPFDKKFDLNDLLTLGFVKVGSVENGIAQNGGIVNILGSFKYLALHDTSIARGDGFDVDAIEVNAIPIPSAAVLFLTALSGLGILTRRKRV